MVRKMSQAEFAKLFHLARPSVGAWEEGRSEPKTDTLIAIAKYLQISIDALVTRELTVDDLFSLRSFKEKMDRVHGHGNEKLKKTASYPIKYVPSAKYFEYIVNFDKADFIDQLEEINVPLIKIPTCRAFELTGSEMEFNQQGLHHGDIIVGKPVTSDKITPGRIYIIVTEQTLLIRRLDQAEKNKLIFTSDDPNYESITIDEPEILERWEAMVAISACLNPPTRLEERVLLLEKKIDKLNGC